MEQIVMAPLNTGARMAQWLEQAWMQRYLERRLDDEESAWFEGYMLDKPELLDSVAADLDLRDALHATPATASQPAPGPAPARRRVAWPLLASAASVLLAFGVGWLTHTPAGGDALVTDPTRYVFDTSRGSGAESSVENPASSSEYVLIDALVPATASYVAVRGTGLPERQLRVSRDGVATVLLRRRELDRIGPLTLIIKSGGREIEKPLVLNKSGE